MSGPLNGWCSAGPRRRFTVGFGSTVPVGQVLSTIEHLTWPDMVALGTDSTLHVGDNGHFLTDPFSVRRLAADGAELGRFGAPGPGLAPGGFGWVTGIVVAPSGGMVVADETNDCIQLINPERISPRRLGHAPPACVRTRRRPRRRRDPAE